MNIYRKRRQRPAVPIITLIDILAILLIFFIVTTTFKQEESLVKVNLPKSSEMATEKTESQRRVALALSKDGEVSIGSRVLSMNELEAGLRRFRAENPDALLELKADEGAPLGKMVKVWDAASRAGLEIKDLPLRILLEK
ncbi:MAG: biopolymer transporter ExbD [Verrucomicrobiales bacterium]|nr:biopolymer transporter ExbD [Verrucomicrobiales bacterium]